VVDSGGRLTGVMRMHNLLFYSRDTRLGDIMITSPLSLPDTASLNELKNFFDEHKLFGVPVVDGDRRLVGVVLPSAVEEEFNKQKTKAFLRLSGIIGGEEFRTMPLMARSGRRLSWLSMNIVLNIIAASVIALYQDTLAAAITLAVFLPMVSDMSGCSGNQAVAVSMRELALGLVKPGEIVWVVLKEARVGIINGVVLGILLGLVAFFMAEKPVARARRGWGAGGKHACLGDAGRRLAAPAQTVENGSRPGFKPAVDHGNRYVRFLFCAQLCGGGPAETHLNVIVPVFARPVWSRYPRVRVEPPDSADVP
jgi:Mg/Co/Ni transporter MgtE